MRFNRKAVVFAAILAGGIPTSAFAQIPNPLDWVFPHQLSQPASAPASGQENGNHCSMDQHENDYINECGELIRGWQGTPVGGG